MASLLQSTIQSTASAAHKAFASMAAASPLKAGDAIPDVEIKINDMEGKVNLSKVPGKIVILTVPGAFSGDCSNQIPVYIKRYEEYKAKGVKEVYVVAINDMFVMQAWRKKLLADSGKEGTDPANTVKFVGDDAGSFGSATGMVWDAQEFFGGPRLKRAAIVAEDGKVISVVVEDAPPNITVTHADEVYKTL